MRRTAIASFVFLTLLLSAATPGRVGVTAPYCPDSQQVILQPSTPIGCTPRATLVGNPLWRPLPTLTPPDGSKVGYSVALSADGSTIVSGAPSTPLNTVGYVTVWMHTSTGWSSTPYFLLPDSDRANMNFGTSVAISADGRVIAVGTDSYSGGGSNRGAIYVYVRPPNGWAATNPFTAILHVSDATDRDYLGRSVAISADGRTIVATAPSDTARAAVYLFTAPTNVWASGHETARLDVVHDGLHQLGFRVAMSADASTIVAIGTTGTGVSLLWLAYVFQRPAAEWSNTLPIAQLTTDDGGEAYHDLTIAPDGSLIVIGHGLNTAPAYGCGAAYIYTRPTGGWINTIQVAKLTASTCVGLYEALGDGVALSADGTTIALGKPYRGAGLIYLYDRPAQGWVDATETTTVSPSDGQQGDVFGRTLALSPDGGLLVSGAWSHAINGAIYLFTRDRAPAFTSTVPLTATLQTPYAYQFTASGTDTPVFQLAAGALPPGIVLDASGQLAGIPTTLGVYHFTVQVSTGIAPDALQTVTFTVQASPLYLPLLGR